MSKWNFKLPDSEEVKTDNTYQNDYEDESKKLKTIDELEDIPNISVKTEADLFNEITNERQPILWGGDISKVTNCGFGMTKNPIPPFYVKKGKDGIIYIHLYWNTQNIPAEGQIYQLLSALTEEDVVHLHIHEIPFWRTTLFQSAITKSKATIHTFVYMLDPHPMEITKFFVWMVGDVLEPIPCDVIGLVEPATIFCYSRGSTEGRTDSLRHDATVKQFWYDFAVQKGLLKLEEIEAIKQNKMVLIKGINSRINNANTQE